jgi:hypothetical protein
MRRRTALALLALFVCLPACTRYADLKEAATVTDVTTGWYDDGVTAEGKNKLVPSITFRIKNNGNAKLGSVQLNLLFKRGQETEEWTTSFVRGVGPNGLAPGASTDPIVVRAQQGYTSTEPRLSMLQNSQFVDFRVEVFGKQGASTWVKLGESPIQRQLITH